MYALYSSGKTYEWLDEEKRERESNKMPT